MRVAFTGRLASMTRREAAELVANHGGEFVAAVTRRTSLLVVGQEGWPLEKDGRLTRKLLRARRFKHYGHPITVLPEQDLLATCGLASNCQREGIHQLYNPAQLCQILRLPRERLRAWMRAGLIQPVETIDGVSYFGFQQVTGAKTLWDLARAGVTPQRIRRSLEQLRIWMPSVDQPLSQLAIIERDGAMLVRLEEGQLAEPAGQLQFDFAEDDETARTEDKETRRQGDRETRTPSKSGPCSLSPCLQVSLSSEQGTADEWFALGCEQEDAGQLSEAAQAYRQALLTGGPDAIISYNLANVLYALGQKEPAAERFHQVVEINPGFAEAWNNLGNVLAELARNDEAVHAYRKAMEANAYYPDAVYNLADLLDQLGCHQEAAQHWRAYLRQDTNSPWGDYARQRLFLSKNG
jgi:tetratricopeptide (TPR) repeat protein